MISLPLTFRATPGKTTMEGGGTHHWLFSGQKTFVCANFVQPHLAKKKFANIVLFLEDRKCGQRSKYLGKKASPIPGHTCLHFFVRLSVSLWPEGKYWCLSFLFVYGIHLQDLNGKWNIRIKILYNIDILFIYGIFRKGEISALYSCEWNDLFSKIYIWNVNVLFALKATNQKWHFSCQV